MYADICIIPNQNYDVTSLPLYFIKEPNVKKKERKKAACIRFSQLKKDLGRTVVKDFEGVNIMADGKTDIIVPSCSINIFFPIAKIYYKQQVDSAKGFTFKELIKAIYEVGYKAITWDLEQNSHQNNKSCFGIGQKKNPTPKKILSKHKIRSGKSVFITGNCIYVKFNKKKRKIPNS